MFQKYRKVSWTKPRVKEQIYITEFFQKTEKLSIFQKQPKEKIGSL